MRKGRRCSRPFPSGQDLCALDRKDRDDVMIAIDDGDLIAHDEVHVSTPLRVNLHEYRRHFDHAHARWHRGADAQSEVDVVGYPSTRLSKQLQKPRRVLDRLQRPGFC